MHRLISSSLGLLDGLLPSLFSTYLNPMYGNLSNFHSSFGHFIFKVPKPIFYGLLILPFLAIKSNGSKWKKYLLFIFMFPIIKFTGYFLMDMTEPEDNPRGIFGMLILQFVLFVLHYILSAFMVRNKLLYIAFYTLGLSITMELNPIYLHLLPIFFSPLWWDYLSKPTKVIKSKQKTQLKIKTSDDSVRYIFNGILILIPILASCLAIVIPRILTSEIILRASTYSNTGAIQVLYHPKYDMTTLRAGHSLIGGQYRNGDCIWGSFYFHEFSRLINRPGIDTKIVVSIGVGIGVTANSFGKLDYKVYAVDIDPVVISFAKNYFGLSGVETISKGGREFLESLKDNSIDYLCHDVFTGGSSPSFLFSTEFFALTKRKLKDNGILTVNLVSHLVPGKDAPLRLLYSTLAQHFKYIDGYRDGTLDIEYVQNIVLYCTNFPIEYRSYNTEDALNSKMRTMFLERMNEFKVMLDLVPDVVLTDISTDLNDHSFDQQFDHWQVMNEMVDKNIWVNYE
eukprot:NODE_51_length_31136_cov_0.357670.p2 type:complete len:510 gc:universal NODE_51_length_31136_cov_0.357670:15114-13585(-)